MHGSWQGWISCTGKSFSLHLLNSSLTKGSPYKGCGEPFDLNDIAAPLRDGKYAKSVVQASFLSGTTLRILTHYSIFSAHAAAKISAKTAK